jgi:hypothetical protein
MFTVLAIVAGTAAAVVTSVAVAGGVVDNADANDDFVGDEPLLSVYADMSNNCAELS